MDIRNESAWAEPGLRVFHRATIALGTASDPDALADACVRAAGAVVGADVVAARLVLPTHTGRFVTAGTQGAWPALGRAHVARRRTVVRTGASSALPLREPAGWTIGAFPVSAGGDILGVLEVFAPGSLIADSWEVLEILAAQTAVALSNLREQARLRQQAHALGTTVTRGVELMRARTVGSALRAAARFQAELSGGPVAAWLAGGEPAALHLVAIGGVGARARRGLRAGLGVLRPWSSLSELERRQVLARFEQLVGCPEVMVLDRDEVLVLSGVPGAAPPVSIDVVGALLDEALLKVSVLEGVDRRTRQLDMGLAWTAHELRGPLLGVKAALELVQRDGAGSADDRALLLRAERDVEVLASTTDGLLRWAVGAEPLRCRWTDVVPLVEDVARSCRPDAGGDRIVVRSPGRVMAQVDANHLRVALANIVRNALAYAPEGSAVQIGIEAADGLVEVRVSDRGPGVPASERDRIFDPFVRGESGTRSPRDGRGLGLYIARRVVEAHGGRIAVEPEDVGVTFSVRLPVARTLPGRTDREAATWHAR